MVSLKQFLAAATVAAGCLLTSVSANALVYNPYNDAAGPGASIVSSVTGGYTASYLVTDGQPESPANSSPGTILGFTESITGLSLTSASNSGCPGSGREGLGGISGSNKKCVGNVFTVKTNDDNYLIYVYAAALALDAFQIDLFGTRGGGLSHLDVYNGTPSPVPLPPAVLLLASGIAGVGVMKRRRKA